MWSVACQVRPSKSKMLCARFTGKVGQCFLRRNLLGKSVFETCWRRWRCQLHNGANVRTSNLMFQLEIQLNFICPNRELIVSQGDLMTSLHFASKRTTRSSNFEPADYTKLCKSPIRKIRAIGFLSLESTGKCWFSFESDLQNELAKNWFGQRFALFRHSGSWSVLLDEDFRKWRTSLEIFPFLQRLLCRSIPAAPLNWNTPEGHEQCA